ncbi:MAG TPA: ABC transporter permease [Geminicoccus sp.]|jgi:NitT/TauT family transport system permease protein|uniref:ABC transporter permease n=1 Tax=Geminicoccus sp. TaxID=2024832 RepID=UPI002E3410A1|nr:ABC transporter permease [Geminicoccus sp.]HEX2524764.1 ABC transporter permease [Geminicoccus sp.]
MTRHLFTGLLLSLLLLAGCWWTLGQVHAGPVGGGFWLVILSLLVVAWFAMDQLAADAIGARLVPVLFGAWILFLWEVVVVGFQVPHVLLPPPSAIGQAIRSHLDMLRADFVQTFVRAVVPGWLMGCGAGFVTALLIDRSPFLQRGLLPVGNLVSALPIIGVAPIMVMWFGFDWQSKAAVVVIMTFFPMLVNTTAGLSQTSAIERDLMHSYAASYVQTLVSLRLPAAMPFIFNALKINATLALIGALVAEFFGTPIVGMGFRISTEVGRMNLDVVWATIAVAALAGSLSYALLAGIERMVTFWHPSYRRR